MINRIYCFGGGWLLTCAALSGCANLNWQASKSAPVADPTTQCTIDYRAAKRPPEVKTFHLPADSTVQQVINQSGASKKFARAKFDLYRQSNPGSWHRMGIEYDVRSKQVDAMHDYHVRPGDRLVVTEDNTTALDDAMKSAGGPLADLLKR